MRYVHGTMDAYNAGCCCALCVRAPAIFDRRPAITVEPPGPMTLLRAYGPPEPETWQILDRSDNLGPWWLVRDRNYAGYSPIHTNDLRTALEVWHRRSVA